MDEEYLDPLVREAIIDYFDPWDLVEFLGITTERLVDLITEEIIDNLPDIKDEMRMENIEDDGE